LTKKTIATYTLILLFILASICSKVSSGAPLQLSSAQAIVKFEPQFSRVYPNQTFTVSVRIENVTSLYGLEIQITWDTTYLKYSGHTATIPVEAYAEGVLHEPLIWINDDVDENASMPGAEPETRYWVTVVSAYPAPSFNGNGNAFHMTFKALNNMGRTALNFTYIMLGNDKAKPIPFTSFNGRVTVTFPGDVNSDLKVDGKDIAFLAKAYNTRPGDSLWNPDADVNNDGKVDGKDVATAAKNYGKSV